MFWNIIALVVFTFSLLILAVGLGANAMCRMIGLDAWFRDNTPKSTEFEWQPYFFCALLALSAGRLIFAMILS